ncbi:MAG: hypothetical protein IJR60_08695 [Eubacterium sp.]|nr:hypothetical protein [Eubacterium sp.]
MKKISDAALAVMLTLAIALLTVLSPQAKAGAQSGISMCENVIIPSLLPVMMLANLLQKSSAAGVFELLLGRLFRRVLNLPESAVTPVIFGLIGGYPTGAVLTFEQYAAGRLTQQEARRIMRFNFSGGLAFTVSAVGGWYNSTKTGVLLFIIIVLSDIIIALAFPRKGEASAAHSAELLPLSDALCSSAEVSSKSVILMSAYIILFCSLTGIAKPPQFLAPILEITSGIFTSTSRMPLPYCAFFLSFGGLCVHLQIAGLLAKMRVKYAEFLLCRVLAAVLSFALCAAYCKTFPQSVSVFSDSAGGVPLQFSQSASVGIIAMLGCAALVLDIESRKIRL